MKRKWMAQTDCLILRVLSTAQYSVGLLMIMVLCLCVYAINEEAQVKEEKTPEPKELILQALQQIDNIKGYHYKIKFTMGVNEVTGKSILSIPCTMEGVYQRTDDTTYGIFDMMGSNKTDVYQKGMQVVIKDNKADKWVTGSPEGYPLPTTQWQFLKTALEKASFVSEEKIGEEVCQIADVSVDQKGIEKFVDQLSLSAPAGESITYTYKVWLGKKPNLIHKIFTSIDVPREPSKKDPQGPKTVSRLIFETEIFDYDKNIEIVIPEAAKQILDKPPVPPKSDKKTVPSEGDKEKGKEPEIAK